MTKNNDINKKRIPAKSKADKARELKSAKKKVRQAQANAAEAKRLADDARDTAFDLLYEMLASLRAVRR